jgi:hypothetical protein
MEIEQVGTHSAEHLTCEVAFHNRPGGGRQLDTNQASQTITFQWRTGQRGTSVSNVVLFAATLADAINVARHSD